MRRFAARKRRAKTCGRAAEVRVIAESYGRVPGAKDWNALGLALETAAFLTDRAVAVDCAEPDADRHLRAARQRLKRFAAEAQPSGYHAAVRAAKQYLRSQPRRFPSLFDVDAGDEG